MTTIPRSSAGPLEGLRILEVSSFVAAPLAGMTLTQLGAEVIRIDPHGGAADADRWPVSKETGRSLYWAGLNKGKKSVTIDFAAEDGRALVARLLETGGPGGGIILTNAVGRDWLEYEALIAYRPDLIHVRVQGRRDGSAAVDYTVNAGVGLPLVTGPVGTSQPVNHVLPAWDIACGLYACIAVIAAERRRRSTGEGSSVEVALEDVAIATIGNLGFLAEAELNHVERERIGNHLYGGFARDFVCRDGNRIMLAVVTARQWRRLVQAAELVPAIEALQSALAVDFADEGVRFDHRNVLAALFEAWFANHDLAQVGEMLDASGVPWSVYRNFQQLAAHLESDPLLVPIDQPGIGKYRATASPMRWDGAVSTVSAAPLIGADTSTVTQHGWGDDAPAQGTKP